MGGGNVQACGRTTRLHERVLMHFFLESAIDRLRGRGETIRINPLTFREYHSCFGGEKADAWLEAESRFVRKIGDC